MDILSHCGSYVQEDKVLSSIAFTNGNDDVKKTGSDDTLFPTLEILYEQTEEVRSLQDTSSTKDFSLQRNLAESQLRDFLLNEGSRGIEPILKLIHVESESKGKSRVEGKHAGIRLMITKARFLELLHHLKADLWVLRLISSHHDGLNVIKARKGMTRDTYHFGYHQAAMIWTFDPDTMITRVISMSRSSAIRTSFAEILGRYRSHIVTPYVPVMAKILQIIFDYDSRLVHFANMIVEAEEFTGFTDTEKTTIAGSSLIRDTNELAERSRNSAMAQINIVNYVRHHDNCMRALEIIETTHDKSTSRVTIPKWMPTYEEKMHDICDSIEVLRMRADSFAPYANHLQSRAEAQISVIFALLTHADARISTGIAKAARRDGEAMKTIAIMTMAFLPATFLATLFALPILDWESKSVMQISGIKLYWGIAVPLTILVFVVQGLLVSERVRTILDGMVKSRKGNQIKEKVAAGGETA